MTHIRMNLGYDILNSPRNRNQGFVGVIPLESGSCIQASEPLSPSCLLSAVATSYFEEDESIQTLSSVSWFPLEIVYLLFFNRRIIKLFSNLCRLVRELSWVLIFSCWKISCLQKGFRLTFCLMQVIKKLNNPMERSFFPGTELTWTWNFAINILMHDLKTLISEA